MSGGFEKKLRNLAIFGILPIFSCLLQKPYRISPCIMYEFRRVGIAALINRSTQTVVRQCSSMLR